MNLYLNSAAQFTDGESSLFWNDPDNKPDQQVRVDFIDPGAAITTTNVLLSIFQTTSSTSTERKLQHYANANPAGGIKRPDNPRRESNRPSAH